MNDGNQAWEWDEAARHLVRAHGADPDRLLSLGLPLNKLKWVHFDTHAALEIAGLQPPVRHVHRELPDPDRDARSDDGESFRPFRSAPGALTPAPTFWAHFYADYSYTGLPQTGIVPPLDVRDVTGRWASVTVEALGGYFAAGCPETDYDVRGSPAARAVREHFAAHGQLDVTAAQAIAEFRDEIKRQAAAVALRFQVKASFPAVPGRPGPQRPSSTRTGQHPNPRQVRRR